MISETLDGNLPGRYKIASQLTINVTNIRLWVTLDMDMDMILDIPETWRCNIFYRSPQ